MRTTAAMRLALDGARLRDKQAQKEWESSSRARITWWESVDGKICANVVVENGIPAGLVERLEQYGVVVKVEITTPPTELIHKFIRERP